MNLRHLLVSILGLGILTSCKNSGYQKKNGLVYYQERLVESADYTSFESLNPVFGRDKHQAYYRGKPLENSTGTRFTALDEHYGKDHQAVFYCTNYIDFKLFETTRKDRVIQISTADVGSFEVIINEYARDKFRCYYQGIGFAVKKVASFEPLDYGFGRDEQVGYFDLKPILASEGNSFVVLSKNYAKDNRQVYYAWTKLDNSTPPGIQLIEEASPATFSVIGMYYAKDKAHVYYQDKPLEAADPVSFHQWDDYTIDYGFDSHHVYFQHRQIAGATKANFTLLTDGYAQNGRTVFFNGDPLETSELKSFQILEAGYAKDSKQVYYNGKMLVGADPVSFNMIKNEAGRDAADKIHSYYEGHQLKPEEQE